MQEIFSLVKFTLLEYYRATGLICEAFITCLFIFLFSDKYWLLKPFDVYFGLGIFAMTASFITTFRVAGREANLRMYIILSRNVSRSRYILAKLTASVIITASMIMCLFCLGYCLCDIRSSFLLVEALIRLAPIYIVSFATVAITLFFSKIVYGSMLSSIVLIIFSFTHPPGFLNYFLPPFQQLIKMSFGVFKPYFFVYIFWGVFCIAFFLMAALRIFKSRELNFEKK